MQLFKLSKLAFIIGFWLFDLLLELFVRSILLISLCLSDDLGFELSEDSIDFLLNVLLGVLIFRSMYLPLDLNFWNSSFLLFIFGGSLLLLTHVLRSTFFDELHIAVTSNN